MNCGIVIRPDSPGGTTFTARARSSGPVAAVAPAMARAMASTAKAMAIRERISDGFYASSPVSFRRRSEASAQLLDVVDRKRERARTTGQRIHVPARRLLLSSVRRELDQRVDETTLDFHVDKR